MCKCEWDFVLSAKNNLFRLNLITENKLIDRDMPSHVTLHTTDWMKNKPLFPAYRNIHYMFPATTQTNPYLP